MSGSTALGSLIHPKAIAEEIQMVLFSSSRLFMSGSTALGSLIQPKAMTQAIRISSSSSCRPFMRGSTAAGSLIHPKDIAERVRTAILSSSRLFMRESTAAGSLFQPRERAASNLVSSSPPDRDSARSSNALGLSISTMFIQMKAKALKSSSSELNPRAIRSRPASPLSAIDANARSFVAVFELFMFDNILLSY
ncbi:MAG: hypothetical protein WBI09_09525 [Methanothrix sp.]